MHILIDLNFFFPAFYTSFGLFVLSDSFSQLYFLIFLLQLKNFGYLISKNSFLLFVPFFLPMLFMDEISFQKFFSPYTHCILPWHTLFLFVWQVLEDILQRTGRKPKKKNRVQGKQRNWREVQEWSIKMLIIKLSPKSANFFIEHIIKTIKIHRSQIDYFCHSNNSLEIVVHWGDGQLGAKT